MGMSFQGGALFGSMTVGENVALPLREHTKLEDPTIDIMLRLNSTRSACPVMKITFLRN